MVSGEYRMSSTVEGDCFFAQYSIASRGFHDDEEEIDDGQHEFTDLETSK